MTGRLSTLCSVVLSALLVPVGVLLALWLRWCWHINDLARRGAR